MDSHFGKFRMRGWPNGRGLTLPPHTAYMNDWFRKVSFLTKRVAGPQMNIAIDLSKGTGLYPRDVLMKMMTKPMYVITEPDGTVVRPQRQGIYPVAFQGVRVVRTSNIALPSFTDFPIPFQQAEINTSSMWDAVFPTRIIIPPGVNIVNLTAGLFCTTGSFVTTTMRIRKNGTDYYSQQGSQHNPNGGAQSFTGPIRVDEGDYFEAVPISTTGLTIQATPRTFFAAEILDAQYPEV